MLLSIVVPCYNVEQYVEKCIDSIEAQDLSEEDYEVLAYNDGSKDCTLNVLEKLADKYPNVKIASHENRGLSGTRNQGINEAQGDFIWFIDSDDWIEINCLGSILNELNTDTDVLAFDSFIPEGGRLENSTCYNRKVIDKESLFREGFADAVQFYIYRREFLLNYQCFFKEGIKHEDTLFTPVTLYKAKNIKFYRKATYHFLQREGSITTIKDVKRIYDLNDNMSYLSEYADNIKDLDVREGFLNHIAHHIIEMLNYGFDNGTEGEKIVKQIMHEHPNYWRIMKDAIDLKPRLIYWIVKFSPLPFATISKMMTKLR